MGWFPGGAIISHVFRLNWTPPFSHPQQSGMLRWNTGSSHFWVRETWHFWANRRYTRLPCSRNPTLSLAKTQTSVLPLAADFPVDEYSGLQKKKQHTLPTFDGMVFERISLKEKMWGKFFHLIHITTGIASSPLQTSSLQVVSVHLKHFTTGKFYLAITVDSGPHG